MGTQVRYDKNDQVHRVDGTQHQTVQCVHPDKYGECGVFLTMPEEDRHDGQKCACNGTIGNRCSRTAAIESGALPPPATRSRG